MLGGGSPPRPLSVSPVLLALSHAIGVIEGPPHEKAQPKGWAFNIWLPSSFFELRRDKPSLDRLGTGGTDFPLRVKLPSSLIATT